MRPAYSFLMAGAVVMALAVSPVLAQTRPSIEVEALTELNAWSVGSIAPSSGGLPRTLWLESDPEALRALFDRTPGDFASPAARSLARRALASAAEAPLGETVEVSRKRFEALGRIGAVEDLLVMTRPAAIAADPLIAQFAAQADMARGDLGSACLRAQAGGSAYLLRLRAFCAAVEGNVGAVDLTLSLLREGGEARDQWFEQVVTLIGGAPPSRPPAARYDTSLHTWLSLAGNLAPARNPLNGSSTLALVALASADRGDARLRAEAGLAALGRSALDPAAVRALYRAALATGDARTAPPLALAIAQAEALPGSMEAATALATALNAARTQGEFIAIARVLQPDLTALVFVPDAAMGVTLARGALAAGDSGTGLRLLDLAVAAGAEQSTLGSLRAAGFVSVRGLSEAQAARVVRQRIDDGASNGAAMRDVLILQALGFPVDASVRRAQLAQGPVGGRPADAAVLAALQSAAEAEAVGEAALLAAIATAGGADALDGQSLWVILNALRLVGLEDAAHAIGMEALLTRPS